MGVFAKNSSATRPADDNIIRKEHVDLYLLSPGTVVDVVTESGSHYYVSTIKGRYVAGGNIIGASVISTSESFGQMIRNPMQVRVTRHVRVGDAIEICSGRTSEIVGIRVLN